CLFLALGENLRKVLIERYQVLRRALTQAELYLVRLARGKCKMVMDRRLCPYLCRIDCLLFTVHDIVIDAIFDVGTGIRTGVEPSAAMPRYYEPIMLAAGRAALLQDLY